MIDAHLSRVACAFCSAAGARGQSPERWPAQPDRGWSLIPAQQCLPEGDTLVAILEIPGVDNTMISMPRPRTTPAGFPAAKRSAIRQAWACIGASVLTLCIPRAESDKSRTISISW